MPLTAQYPLALYSPGGTRVIFYTVLLVSGGAWFTAAAQ